MYATYIWAMAITLRELIRTASFHLSALVDGRPEALDEPISWVHATELIDPTPYVEGGELILTTGLQLSEFEPMDDRERRYVERLNDKGVRGIGFGTGIHHTHVPQWLVAQCESWNVPLIAIPQETPFIAIEKSISRSLADSKQQTVLTLYNEQRQLFRSIETLDPLSSIIKRLAELIGGWAAFINPLGKVMESSHAALPLEMRGIDDALNLTAVGQAKFLYSHGYDIAIFHVASAQRQSLGYLVAGRFGEKNSLNHPLVAQAAALLSLAVSRSASAERSLARLRSAMMRLCLEGDVDSVREYAGDLWDGLPPEPLSVIRIVGEPEVLDSAQMIFEPLHQTLAKNLNPAVSGIVEGDLWAVISQSNLKEWMEQVVHDSRLVSGVSSGFVWTDAPRARHEAYQACAEAVASGKAVVQYGQRSGTATLEKLIEPSLLRAFGDLRLAPIRDLTFRPSTGPHRDGEGTAAHAAPGTQVGSEEASGPGAGPAVREKSSTVPELAAMTVLRTWLQSGCRYEETAERLGLHRHTVRKYVAQICSRLGVDVSQPGQIAELWFACKGSQFGRKR